MGLEFLAHLGALSLSVLALAGLVAHRWYLKKALSERDDRLDRVMRASNSIAWEIDLPAGVMILSDSLNRMYDVGDDSPTPQEFIQFVHPEDREQIWKAFFEIPHDVDLVEGEYRSTLPDGQTRRFRGEAHVERDRRGRPIRLTGCTRDITEEHGAQAKLRSQAAVIQSMTDSVLIMDGNGVIQDCNDAATKLSGLSRDDLMARNLADFNDMIDFPDGGGEEIEENLNLKGEWRGQYFMRHEDGHRIPVESAFFTMEDPARDTGLVIVARDLSEREEMSVALAETEDRLQRALNVAQTGAWEIDAKTGEFSYTDTLCDLLGLPPGSINSADQLLETVHPDDQVRTWASVVAPGPDVDNVEAECRCITASGEIRNFRILAHIDRDVEGELLRITGVSQDITDKVMAERALRTHSAVIQATADTVIISDPDGTIRDINPSGSRLVGRPREELIGENIYKMWDWTALPGVSISQLEDALRSKGEWRAEHTIGRDDGTIVPVESAVFTITGDDARTISRVTVIRDVSERKLAETALHENERRLAWAQQKANLGSWGAGTLDRCVYLVGSTVSYPRSRPRNAGKWWQAYL